MIKFGTLFKTLIYFRKLSCRRQTKKNVDLKNYYYLDWCIVNCFKYMYDILFFKQIKFIQYKFSDYCLDLNREKLFS